MGFIDVYCVNNKLDFKTCSGEPQFEVRVFAELHVPHTKPTPKYIKIWRQLHYSDVFLLSFQILGEN